MSARSTRVRKHKYARRYSGHFCSVLGFILIITGLFIYFQGPIKNENFVWKYEESSEKFYIHANKSIDHSYCAIPALMEMSPLFLDAQINVSINVEGGRWISIYIMNATLYEQWKNGSITLEQIKGIKITSGSISFRLFYNTTYHVIMSNVASETVSVSVKVSTFYTIQAFNFSNAFNGLKISSIGVITFAISFVLGNPIDRLIRRGLRTSFFPRVNNYSGKKDPSEIAITIVWILAGCIIIVVLYALFSTFAKIPKSELPDPLIPLIEDAIIRYGLFIVFMMLIIIGIWFFIGAFIHKVIKQFLLYFFGIRYGRIYDFKFNERVDSYFLREAVSPLSIITYIILCALFMGCYRYDFLVTLTLIVLLLSLVFGHALSISFHKTCKELKVDYEKKFEQQKFFYYAGFTSFLFMSIFSFSLWFFSWDISFNAIYSCSVGSAMLMQLIPTKIRTTMLGSLLYVFDYLRIIKGMFLLLVMYVIVVSCWSFFFFSYYVFPTRTRKARIKNLLTQIWAFLLTFVTIQIIMFLSQPNFNLTSTSILTSFAFSSLSTFLKSSLTCILSRPT
ncbi:MAG: hypothetical protein QXU81_09155 [Candidatus Bathyarchaeia archaeon]